MEWTRDELINLARGKARLYGLNEFLVCALSEQESSWSTYAIRFEPAFYARYIAPMNGLSATEAYARAFSWGLLQVMGQVAREYGFEGPLSTLCIPDKGLEIGCKHLKSRMDLATGNEVRALQLYNGGGNPNYAAEVQARKAKYTNAGDLSLHGDV